MKSVFLLTQRIISIVAASLILSCCEISEYPFFTRGGCVTVAVDGRSGPWDFSVNKTGNYGGSTQTAPCIVDRSTGFVLYGGGKITVEYVSGKANSGGGGLWYDADGVDDNGTYPPANGESGSISSFMKTSELPVNLGELVGVFTDDKGVMVGTPFRIGNGPRHFTVPEKATRLQLGVNDGMYSDNGGTLMIKISQKVD